jgi:hypothetical protein
MDRQEVKPCIIHHRKKFVNVFFTFDISEKIIILICQCLIYNLLYDKFDRGSKICYSMFFYTNIIYLTNCQKYVMTKKHITP